MNNEVLLPQFEFLYPDQIASVDTVVQLLQSVYASFQ